MGDGREEPPPPLRRTLTKVVGVGLASGIPLLAYGALNKVMGQDWLPNSVVAKSDSLNSSERIPEPREVMETLTRDPMLVLAVAGLIHSAVAQVGWHERYQLYLIGLAVYVGFRAAAEVPRPMLAARPRLAPLLVLLLVLLLLLFTTVKVSLTVEAPRAVADTYEQRYQAALFLEQYYDGEAVATGELGYVSLEHTGPLTDLIGLGDYEVLEALKRLAAALMDEGS